MRRIMIAAALTVAAGAAQASSIEVFTQSASSKSSIIVIGCPSCVQAAKKAEEEKLAPPMAPGTQTVKVRLVDGKPMVYRTDNWLGGSAVTWVSKGTPLELQAYGFEPDIGTKLAAQPLDDIHQGQKAISVAEAPSDANTDVAEAPETTGADTADAAAKMIDRSATTAAIVANAAGGPKLLDVSNMKLRLN